MERCIDCGEVAHLHLPCATLRRGERGASLCAVCAAAYATPASRGQRLRAALSLPHPPAQPPLPAH
jgi:hypothetical protein